MDAGAIAADGTALTYFERLPKVELHLHLEGAIPLPSLWQLVQKYGGAPEVPTVEALASKFRYRDFAHFIDTWVWKNQFLREYEDFSFVAAEVARDLASQNLVYAEAFYSPGDYRRQGLDPQRITQAIRKGLREVSDIDVALITDLIRDHGPERGHLLLSAIHEVRDEFGVVGIGIGGSEHRYPPEPFAQVYDRARTLGFRTTAHAGEACGPESVWGAIRALRVDRVGHGTRAIEDPALVDHLAEQRIPLELCIISNLRTGVISSVETHPARKYFERGIPISINTDDPKLFDCSLAEEYLALHTEQGFSKPEIHRLIEQAVSSSWLPDLRKLAFLERIRAGIQAVFAGEP
jgi:adenosine deaminase